MHSIGQSLVSLEGVLLHRLPLSQPPQPMLSPLLAEATQRPAMICNQLPPSTESRYYFLLKFL